MHYALKQVGGWELVCWLVSQIQDQLRYYEPCYTQNFWFGWVHGHFGSKQMLKNVENLSQKWKCSENKASNCKSENVWYLQGQLVPWISVFVVSDSYWLQYSTNIWIWTKQGNVENVNRFKNEGFIFYWILVVTGWKSCCCTKYA